MSGYTVYALAEPEDGKWRYVGITLHPSLRFDQHLSAARTGRDLSPKGAWIREVLERGDKPTYEILRDGLSQDVAVELERMIIGKWDLLNLSKGGQTGAMPRSDRFRSWLPTHLADLDVPEGDIRKMVQIIASEDDWDVMDPASLELVRASTRFHHASLRLRAAVADHPDSPLLTAR